MTVLCPSIIPDASPVVKPPILPGTRAAAGSCPARRPAWSRLPDHPDLLHNTFAPGRVPLNA